MMSQRDLPAAKVLRLAWQRHYAYEQGEVRFKGSKEITKEDPEVELRPGSTLHRQSGEGMGGLQGAPHRELRIDGVGLITKVITTPALTQAVSCTEVIQRSLWRKGCVPRSLIRTDSTSIGISSASLSRRESDRRDGS